MLMGSQDMIHCMNYIIENYYEEKCRDKLVHMHMDETVDDSANEK